MKIKPLLSGILIMALLCAVFSSCNPLHKADETTKESVSEDISFAETETQNAADNQESETEEERTTVTGFTEVNSFREVALDKAGVVELYTKTVNEVKIRCPGFTKTDYQTVEDVSAGNGKLQLANRILELVSNELTGGDRMTAVKVAPHNDIEVIKKFPIYNQGYACGLTELSIIDTAVCYTDGNEDKIVITVANTLNPEPVNSDFGKILTPVNRENVATGILSYLSNLNLDDYLFDFNYTGNEITCVIDRESGRIKSLTQKMIIKVDIDLDIDLFFFSANLIEAHGTVINKLEYTDFIWD